jgi:hypothetical protein
MKSAMRIAAACRLLMPWVVATPLSCAAPGPSATPASTQPEQGRTIEQEQRAIEARRLRLHQRVMTELRKLRESRQASTGAVEAGSERAPESAEDQLLVFGGVNRETFLGCLCQEQHPDSIFNLLGEHGSHDSPSSLRNKFARYGSNHDDTSACSPAAKHPPVVLAADGKTLGLLSVNRSLERRIQAPSVNDWLGRMCSE